MKIQFVEIEGKGSSEFLHRVTAGKVRGVGVGQGAPGLLLNGQSRVIAQFDLLRVGESKFHLAAPVACASALVEGLEALHFAEEFEIHLKDRFAYAAPGSGAREGVFSVGDTWPSPVPGFVFSPVEGSVSWEPERIAALVPWPGSEWGESTPALEAGMLPWIDRDKGCYPGQEVVELSLNVGHPARVLVAVEGLSATAGERVPWDTAEATVTSASGDRAIVRIPWAKRDFLPSGVRKLKSHW